MIFASDLCFVILFSFKLAARLIHMVFKEVFSVENFKNLLI